MIPLTRMPRISLYSRTVSSDEECDWGETELGVSIGPGLGAKGNKPNLDGGRLLALHQLLRADSIRQIERLLNGC